MRNLKANQRDRLIMEFGLLIKPFQELADAATPPTHQQYRIAIAKVQAGQTGWASTVREFTTFAPDTVFEHQTRGLQRLVTTELCRTVRELLSRPDKPQELHGTFKNAVDLAKDQFFALLQEVPVEWEPVIFDANTPFTSYLRIKESMAVVNRRLDYFDRYLKEPFFQLFLNTVPRTVAVRLVTTAGHGGTNASGVAGVLHVSALCRQEFTDYKLIQVDPANIHDRNLRVDDQIFNLGPGVDRAGIALTNFGPADSSADAHKGFDDIIARGTVIHSS